MKYYQAAIFSSNNECNNKRKNSMDKHESNNSHAPFNIVDGNFNCFHSRFMRFVKIFSYEDGNMEENHQYQIKLWAHSSWLSNQIHSNWAYTHHEAKWRSMFMWQRSHKLYTVMYSSGTFYHLKKLLCIYMCHFWHLFYFHNRMVSTLHQFSSFPRWPDTKWTTIQYFHVSVNLSIHISSGSCYKEQKRKKKNGNFVQSSLMICYICEDDSSSPVMLEFFIVM